MHFGKEEKDRGPDGVEEGGQRERTGDETEVERNNVAHVCGCGWTVCCNSLGYFFLKVLGLSLVDYKVVRNQASSQPYLSARYSLQSS